MEQKMPSITPRKRTFFSKLRIFLENSTAHGFDKACSKNITTIGRFFWSLVLCLSFIGLIWTIVTRVTHYREAMLETSYSSTIKASGPDGLSFPSISICSEGFSSEFATIDLMIAVEDRMKVYYQEPNYLLQRVLNKEGQTNYFKNNKIVNLLTVILEISILDLHGNGNNGNNGRKKTKFVDKCQVLDKREVNLLNLIKSSKNRKDIKFLKSHTKNLAKIFTSQNSSFSFHAKVCYMRHSHNEESGLHTDQREIILSLGNGNQYRNISDSALLVQLIEPVIAFHLGQEDDQIFNKKFAKDFDQMAFHLSIQDIIKNPPTDNIKIYLNNTHFVNVLDDLIMKASNYSQFYKPRFTFDKIAEVIGINKIHRDHNTIKVVPKCNHCDYHDDIVYEFINLTTRHFEIFRKEHNLRKILKNWKDVQPLEGHKGDEVNYFKRMQDLNLNIDSNIYSLKIFGVNIKNTARSEHIKISKHINFDATCFRLDFEQKHMKQRAMGISNGLELKLKIPKLYNGIFDRPLPKIFPRRSYKLEEFSKGMQGSKHKGHEIPDFSSDVYILIYPNYLAFPTVESKEVASTLLHPNTAVKVGISQTHSTHIFDPLERKLECNQSALPFEECLKNLIKCQPLHENSTCPYITQPIHPIDPHAAFCHPQSCHCASIKIEKVLTYDIDTCENQGSRENSVYFLELYESCIGSQNFIYSEFGHFRNYLTRQCYHQLLNIYQANHSNAYKYEYDNLCSILTGQSKPEKFPIDIHSSDINPKTWAPKYNPDLLYDNYEVSVGFETLYIYSLNEVYLDTFISCIIDIFGTTGFWMGFSFITAFEFLLFMFLILKTTILNYLGYTSHKKIKRILRKIKRFLLNLLNLIREKIFNRNETNIEGIAQGFNSALLAPLIAPLKIGSPELVNVMEAASNLGTQLKITF